ncbi:MAG: cell division protein FtsL [Pyrinomonadaceae bacterium]
MVRRIPSRQRNAPVARERDRGAPVRLALLLLCGLALAGGFVYAGGQHFAALKFGYQTEDLRNVREQLAEEQRRFLLEREAAASPARLERAARQLGMQPMQAAQIDPLRRAVKSSTEKNLPAVSQSPSASRSVALPARNGQAKLIQQPTPARAGPVASQSDSARTR